MKKSVTLIVVFAIIGLVLGYLIFGRISGEYVGLDVIFNQSDNAIESLGRQLAGIQKMKQNILISGGGGAIVGFVISLIRKK